MKSTKEIPEGFEECPVCDGKGEAYFSCCGGEIVDEDMPLCPGCRDWVGESECEECGGTGLVRIEDKVEAPIKYNWIDKAEAYSEGER